jgi:hypothetical protein
MKNDNSRRRESMSLNSDINAMIHGLADHFDVSRQDVLNASMIKSQSKSRNHYGRTAPISIQNP